ncbi:hypothetical protein N7523_005724 [Penicillium sp. IBT 18751x]|nr:hypothetical protein N7523_005724 [Penicillium sp. IBT 18751x]
MAFWEARDGGHDRSASRGVVDMQRETDLLAASLGAEAHGAEPDHGAWLISEGSRTETSAGVWYPPCGGGGPACHLR